MSVVVVVVVVVADVCLVVVSTYIGFADHFVELQTHFGVEDFVAEKKTVPANVS